MYIFTLDDTAKIRKKTEITENLQENMFLRKLIDNVKRNTTVSTNRLSKNTCNLLL